MKKSVCVAVLMCVFVFAPIAAAYAPPDQDNPPGAPYDPPTVSVEPTLLAKYQEFFPAKVLKVTDGVWVARGYNRDNPTLIEGVDGLIVVDPGESIQAGEKAKEAFNAALNNIFDKKPVKAIIYTHHHDCHVNAASVFADENTEIIGHESLLSNLFSEWFGMVFPSRAEGGIKMSGGLFMDAPVMPNANGIWEGWYVGYGIAAPQIFGDSGFMAPTKTIGQKTRMTIAGVDVELIPVIGETPDVLLVWLPDKRVLIEIAIVYEAFPAISTMRGSRQRDPQDYINSLKTARSLNAKYLVAIHGPNPVTKGEKEVREYLTNFSDAIQFVNDQTVQYLNKGYTAAEMVDEIVLPEHLANSPYLQQTYGRQEWNIFHFFRYYRGFYTGEVRDLFPQTTESEAGMSAFLASGGGDLTSKAADALNINPEWALRLADDALVLDPGNDAAFETKKAAMLQLAAETMNSQARNMLLSDYLLMTGQAETKKLEFGNPEAAFNSIEPVFVKIMPVDTLHRILAVNLNAEKAIPLDKLVGLQLTDVAPDHYTLNIRKGILEVNPPGGGHEQFVIVTDSLTWKQLVLYQLDPKDAYEKGKVTISRGSADDFYEFMGLFDYQG